MERKFLVLLRRFSLRKEQPYFNIFVCSFLHPLIEAKGDDIASILKKADEKLIFAVTAKEKLLHGTREEKREIIANLGSNPSLKAKLFSIDIEKPLLRIKDIAKEVNDIHGRFEPPGTSANTMDVEQIYASSPTLRWG